MVTYHQSDCPLSAQRRPYLIGRAERGCALQGQHHVSAYFNFLQRPSVLSRWKSQRSVISRYQTAAIVRTPSKSAKFAGKRKAVRPELLHSNRTACPNGICNCFGGGIRRRNFFAISSICIRLSFFSFLTISGLSIVPSFCILQNRAGVGSDFIAILPSSPPGTRPHTSAFHAHSPTLP